jgi:predicted acylesterase/phospholipase RssA
MSPQARARRTGNPTTPQRDAKGRTKAALVLSAGAPNSPLMAGALCAMYEANEGFDIVYTTGGGCLIGLFLVAPKDKTPPEALRGILDMGVSDQIYRMCPIGYKTFFKQGPLTRPIHRLAQHLKIGQEPTGGRLDAVKALYSGLLERMLGRDDSVKRLYNDWIDLCASVMTPTTLFPWSQGLCAPFPFLDDMVDFEKLRQFPGEFYMNAYNLTDSKMEMFAKEDINADHFRAALAYPFIYPPAEIDGKFYAEGADHDPINFGNLMQEVDDGDIKTVVLIDILGSLAPHLARRPHGLWDAYGISMMTPVVALAQKNLQYFEDVENKDSGGKDKITLLKLKFTIPKPLQPHIMEWSYSNLSSLWDIGYEAGQAFARTYGEFMPDIAPPAAPAPAAAAPAAAPVAARPSRSEEERKIEAAQRGFEQRRRELERQELELRRQEVMLHARAEQDEFRACAEKFRAEGRASEAEDCERRGELAAKRAELDRHKVELEAQRVELDAKQMAEARALQEQMERADMGGRDAQIAAIHEAMKALEVDRKRSVEMRMRQSQSVRQVSEEFAKALADQVEAWKAQLRDHPEARPELEQEIRRLDAARKALEAKPQP